MDDDEDEDEELAGFFGFRRRARRGGGDPAPQVPSEEGAKLMASGDFGSNSYYTDELKKRRKSLATRTMWRELGIDLSGPRQEVQAITQVSPWPCNIKCSMLTFCPYRVLYLVQLPTRSFTSTQGATRDNFPMMATFSSPVRRTSGLGCMIRLTRTNGSITKP